MKDNISKTLCVGFVKFIILYIVTTGAMYFSLTNLNEYLWLTVSVFLAIVHALFFVHLYKTASFGKILLMDFLSSCLSLFLIVLELLIRNLIDFNIMPQYLSEKLDDNYGTGIMILLSWGIYCVSVFVFKIIVHIVMAIIRYFENQADIADIPPPSPRQSTHNQGTVQ